MLAKSSKGSAFRSFKGDIDIGTDIDVDIDLDSNVAVSVHWGCLLSCGGGAMDVVWTASEARPGKSLSLMHWAKS